MARPNGNHHNSRSFAERPRGAVPCAKGALVWACLVILLVSALLASDFSALLELVVSPVEEDTDVSSEGRVSFILRRAMSMDFPHRVRGHDVMCLRLFCVLYCRQMYFLFEDKKQKQPERWLELGAKVREYRRLVNTCY
jgi:hypothetical protein